MTNVRAGFTRGRTSAPAKDLPRELVDRLILSSLAGRVEEGSEAVAIRPGGQLQTTDHGSGTSAAEQQTALGAGKRRGTALYQDSTGAFA